MLGKVAVTLKIMPESADSDMSAIMDGVKKSVARHTDIQLKAMEEKPIAFGLKALEILLILPDGSISALESELSMIKGAASVEAGDVTLI